MGIWLKQSTAVTVKLGPFVDATDGSTAETALTISQADIRLSKNGGDIAQSSNTAGATHDELGYYDVPLDTTDTNTLGRLRVLVSESGALPVWQDVMVVPANVWDSLFGADKLQVDAVELSGDSAAADNAEAFFDGTGYAGTNNVIPTVTLVNGLAAGTITAAVVATGAIDADAIAANAITAAAIAADAIGASELAADAVAEIADALWDEARAGHVTAGTFGEAVLLSPGTGTGQVSLSSGQVTVATNNDKTGYGLSAAAVQAVWDALTSALTTVGSIGKLLVDRIDAAISSRSTLSTAQVNAEVVDVLTVDTLPELSQAQPATTPTFATGLMLLYMSLRNKLTQTATQMKLHNNAGTVIAKSATSDDGSTFVRDTLASGP